jgi:hypothetical protein
MRRCQRILGFMGLLLSVIFVGPAFAELTIGEYTLVDSKRVSRVVYEYTFQVQVSNDGAPVLNVVAQASSSSEHTTIVEGELVFGYVPAGTTVASTDTLTLRQDRRYPFDQSAVSWNIQSTDMKPPGIYYKYDALGRIIKIERIPSQ